MPSFLVRNATRPCHTTRLNFPRYSQTTMSKLFASVLLVVHMQLATAVVSDYECKLCARKFQTCNCYASPYGRCGKCEPHYKELCSHLDNCWRWYSLNEYQTFRVRRNRYSLRLYTWSMANDDRPDLPTGWTSFVDPLGDVTYYAYKGKTTGTDPPPPDMDSPGYMGPLNLRDWSTWDTDVWGPCNEAEIMKQIRDREDNKLIMTCECNEVILKANHKRHLEEPIDRPGRPGYANDDSVLLKCSATRRRLTNQSLIDRFIRESIRCEQS